MIADSSYCSAFAVTTWWVLWETCFLVLHNTASTYKSNKHKSVLSNCSNGKSLYNMDCPVCTIKVLLRLSINQHQVHNPKQPTDSTATSMCSSAGQWPTCRWSFRICTRWWPLQNSQNIWRRVTGLAQQWQEPAHCHLDQQAIGQFTAHQLGAHEELTCNIHQMDGLSTHQMTTTHSYLHYKVFSPFVSMFNMTDKSLLKFAWLRHSYET